MAVSLDTDVIIVNYKSYDLTLRCVRSILEHDIAKPENIFVIDNSLSLTSVSDISRSLPSINVVYTGINNGFAAGVNIGLAMSRSDFALVLNPDTYFLNDSVSSVTAKMREMPDVAIAGLDLISPDGSRQFSARRFYSVLDIAIRRLGPLRSFFSGRNDRHLMKDAWIHEVPFDAEWVMGTGFIVRRSILNTIGYMDASYFLYMEDVDYCVRVWLGGMRVIAVPNAELVHDHQRSSLSGPFSRSGRYHLSSFIRFAKQFSVPLIKPPGLKGIGRTS